MATTLQMIQVWKFSESVIYINYVSSGLNNYSGYYSILPLISQFKWFP
jgi:hypothetical protein